MIATKKPKTRNSKVNSEQKQKVSHEEVTSKKFQKGSFKLIDKRRSERKLSIEKYIIAFIITLIIFLLGTTIGFFVEEKRVNYIQNVAIEQRYEFESLQLQYEYINKLKEEQNCPAVLEAFKENINSLEKARERLEEYVADAQVSKSDINEIKQRYILSQIKYWMLAKDTKEICNNTFTDIIYFYDSMKSCPSCENQAMVLNYLKDVFKDKLLIFAFDGNFEDEPLIPLIKNTYNVTTYPTIIINNEVYDSFVSRDELSSKICSINNDTETWICQR